MQQARIKSNGRKAMRWKSARKQGFHRINWCLRRGRVLRLRRQVCSVPYQPKGGLHMSFLINRDRKFLVFCDAIISLVAPQLLHALVAATIVTVEFVTHRIVFLIVLMIVLGWIKFASVFNFSHDGVFQSSRAHQGLLRCFCRPTLV